MEMKFRIRPKAYHYGAKIREDGAVSALCFKEPHPINLKVALWTIRPKAVTCPKCKRLLAARELVLLGLLENLEKEFDNNFG